MTGASGGIGVDLAECYARDGYDLILTARSGDALQSVGARLSREHGVKATTIANDLGAIGGGKKLADEIAKRGLGVDVLVNNAGFGHAGALTTAPLAISLGMIDLNVRALVELTHIYWDDILKQGRGGVLNVASTAAFQPGPLMAVYYATKAYVLSFSEAIALELAGSGVTVTALCPGPTHSGFQSAAKLASDAPLFKSGAVADSASVAEAGYRAMMAGERVHVTGLLNKLGTFGTRFVPRGVSAAIAMKLQEVRKG